MTKHLGVAHKANKQVKANLSPKYKPNNTKHNTKLNNMSDLSHKAVTSYLSSAPDAMNHQLKLMNQTLYDDRGMPKSINMYELEKSTLSAGERNIIKNFTLEDRFCLKDMHKNFEIRVRAAAINKEGHHHRKEETKTYSLSFLSERAWYLDPMASFAHEKTRSQVAVAQDHLMKARLMSACNQLGGNQSQDLNVSYMMDRQTTKTDMRHLYTKLYLLLHDYNLAVSSKCTQKDRRVDFKIEIHPVISDLDRASFMCTNDIVVDADGFTEEELGVLALGAAEYPSVWYAGDNIYTQCAMEADSLAIISDQSIQVESSLAWGSPTRLYSIMVSLACKLGCMDDMMTAFANMRGRCKMMYDMLEHAEENVVVSDMPKSFNQTRALGGLLNWPAATTSNGGYFSTTACLVHDISYGMLFNMMAANLVEETGGLGKQLCETDPKIDPQYNGLLRDHGLNHQDPAINELLLNWSHLHGSPLLWGFSSMIKDYVIGLATKMRMGYDVSIPQWTEMIPYSTSHNTSWGALRGYNGNMPMFGGNIDERKKQEITTATFMWVLGLRNQRPLKGYNKSKGGVMLQDNEREWMTNSYGSFEITSIGMSIVNSIEGRQDETDESAVALYKDEFMHKRYNVVFDYINEWKIPLVESSLYVRDKNARASMKNELPNFVKYTPKPERVEPKDSGQLKVMIGRHDPAIIHTKPIAQRKVDGQELVGEYVTTEGTRNLLVKDEPTPKASERVSLEIINTPGDGSCGLHALVTNMRVRGYCDTTDEKMIFNRMKEEAISDSFHDYQELGHLAKEAGLGVDVYTDGDINGETYHIQRFDPNLELRLPVYHKDNHFSAAIVKQDGKGRLIGNVFEDESIMMSNEQIRELLAVRESESIASILSSPNTSM